MTNNTHTFDPKLLGIHLEKAGQRTQRRSIEIEMRDPLGARLIFKQALRAIQAGELPPAVEHGGCYWWPTGLRIVGGRAKLRLHEAPEIMAVPVLKEKK